MFLEGHLIPHEQVSRENRNCSGNGGQREEYFGILIMVTGLFSSLLFTSAFQLLCARGQGPLAAVRDLHNWFAACSLMCFV